MIPTSRARAPWRIVLFTLCTCQAQTSAPRCSLSEPASIAHAQGLAFDGIAVTAAGDGLLCAWSEAAGLFVRRLSARGLREGAATRVGERCRGGLALAWSASEFFLACSRPGDRDEQALVTLYQLDAGLRAASQRTLGFVGRDGRGVDLGLTRARLHVAYHSGGTHDHAVYYATLDLRRGADGPSLNAAPLQQRRLSARERMAAEPSLLVDAQRVYLAWSETLLGLTESRSAIYVARPDAPPRALRPSASHRAAPRLLRDARGMLLSYREPDPEGRRDALFVARLGEDLSIIGPPRRVGRANSEGAPSVHRCQSTLAALCPLEHGTEHYLALHALLPDGTPSGRNHQFYVSGREFVLAQAACAQGHIIALAAERRAPPEGGAELVSMRFQCDR